MAKEISITKLREKEGRGKLLTTLLVFYCLALVLNGTYLLSQFTPFAQKPTLFPTNPLLEYIYRGISCLVGIVIFIGIIRWEKRALYAYCLLIVIQTILTDIFFYKITFPSLGIALIVQILLGYLEFWIIKRKWHLFT